VSKVHGHKYIHIRLGAITTTNVCLLFVKVFDILIIVPS